LNWDIVDEMSTVKELMLSPAGTAAGADEAAEEDVAAGADVDEDDVVVDEDDEQPAAIKAAAPATATQPRRGRGLFLLPRSIPYTFRRNMRGYVDAGTPLNTCVLR
jgi:hypothetical protein